VPLRRRILVALLAAAWIPLALGVSAEEGSEDEGSKLEDLRAQILEARERVGASEREERDLFERLEQLDRSLDRMASQLADARRLAKRAAEALARTEARAGEATARLEKTRAAMTRRVVALYKMGEVGPLRVLFSSGSLQDLFSRASTLRKLLDHDADLVARYRRDHEAVEKARSNAEEGVRLRDLAGRELESRRSEHESERANKTQLLAKVREDRTLERSLLVELERAARALEEKLVSLGESSRLDVATLDAMDFAAQKGKLPKPVRGSVQTRFGRVVDDEYGTETFNKGIEFEVDHGDSVRAVAFGEVRFAGWFRGYGKIVILDHGRQYFTVSGHLAELFVEVGQTVGRGDTIATAGDTGSLSGPSFYFEVRQGGEPLDPIGWLD
jgi:septal ring factor EnvC (AmiA/AmiB activator)